MGENGRPSLRQVLHQADPNLNIAGGHIRHSHDGEVRQCLRCGQMTATYDREHHQWVCPCGWHVGHYPDTDGTWKKAAGPICGSCGKEFFRGRDGLCYPCWEAKVEANPEIRDQTGLLAWLPKEVLKQITHPSRKPKPQ